MDWYIISRIGVDRKAFYPIYVISKYMDAKYVNYQEAQDIDFTGKNVLLHCVWKLDQYNAWKNLPVKLEKEAANFWIEFDADNHLDKLHTLDGPKDTAMFFYKIFEPCKKFIWEQPMFYNPFGRDVERIEMRCYHPEFEKPLDRLKDIDFFTTLDSGKNVLETMELFTELYKNGFSICMVILNQDLYEFYKDKLSYPVITNARKFSRESIKRFEHLMDRSKVYIDLSPRLTTGRVVYDAAFRGAFFAGTNTYGATNVLFPEYSMTPYPIDINDAIHVSLTALNDWSPQASLDRRKYYRERCGVDGFIREIKERSK